jgi:hypothetical protein
MRDNLLSLEQFMQSHQDLFLVIGIVSAVLFASTLVLVPVVVVNLPADYFVRPKAKRGRPAVAFHILLLIVRNILGVLLLILGVLLLVLPGPGWLTILAAVALIDLPFKHKLEMKILSLPVVRNAVNVARAKRCKKPLLFPELRAKTGNKEKLRMNADGDRKGEKKEKME